MNTGKGFPNYFLVFISSIALLFSFTVGFNINDVDVAQASMDTVIRVSASGTDSSSCGSDSNPCRTLQYAINLARNGDTITVSEGTYVYDSAADGCSFLITPAVACIVDKQISIIGGYPSSNWVENNPSMYVTIIDGQDSWRGVALIKYNTYANLNMEGFTIQNTRAMGVNSASEYDSRGFGAGFWSQNAPFTLRHMVFKQNIAVGADRSRAIGGSASGGGVAVESSPNNIVPVTLEDILFDGNQALGGGGSERGGVALGGALFAYYANVSGSDIKVINNTARAGNSTGDGIDGTQGIRADALGGGFAIQIGSQAVFSGLVTQGNRAIGGNAGQAAGSIAGSGLGGAIHVESSTFSLDGGSFIDNQAIGGVAASGGVAFGGGIMTDLSNTNISNAEFYNNGTISGGSSAGGKVGDTAGGGIYTASYASPGTNYLSLVNSIVAENWVEFGAPGDQNGIGGAGLTAQASNIDIFQSTFNNNYFKSYARYGQAISLEGSLLNAGVGTNANITNSIISEHVNQFTSDTAAVTVFAPSTANLSNVLYSGNTNDMNDNGVPFPAGTIHQTNTMKPTTPVSYVSPGYPDYDYHLQPESPAIDRAAQSPVSLDIDQNPRPSGDCFDIGADEYTVQSLQAAPSNVALITDSNENKTIPVLIYLPSGSSVDWTADTITRWIYLGESTQSKTVSGLTGTELLVTLVPGAVDLGTYTGYITITGSFVEPITVEVRLVKVDEVFQTLIPMITR